MNRGRFVYPDGASLDYSIPLSSNSSWYAISWISSGTSRARINTGPVGAVEATSPLLAHESGETGLLVDEVQSLGSRIARIELAGQTTFVWQGTFNEFYMTVPGTSVPFEAFLSTVNSLDIVDDALGIRLRPRLPKTTTISSRSSTVVHEEGISIQVFPITEIGRSLPDGKGAEVEGGELWHIPAEGAQTEAYLLANDSCAAVVSGNGLGQADTESLLGALTFELEAVR